MFRFLVVSFTLLLTLGLSYPLFGQVNYATSVVDFNTNGGLGGGLFNPANTLGPPVGGGYINGGLDVHSLGVGGSLTLGFDVDITNGPGVDFIVSENAFLLGGSSPNAFSEAVYVEVSSNGTDFARFPNRYLGEDQDPGVFGSLRIGSFLGLAGAYPVIMGNTGYPDVDPLNIVEAGGDAFDLGDLANHALVNSGDVDINAITEIRLVDVMANQDKDSFGNIIWDNGISADIDAVTVIHHTSNQNPNDPRVKIKSNISGKLQVTLSDPNGSSDLDMSTLQVAVFGQPFIDPSSVLVLLSQNSQSIKYRLDHSQWPDAFELGLSVCINDLSGGLSCDQSSRLPPKIRQASAPLTTINRSINP